MTAERVKHTPDDLADADEAAAYWKGAYERMAARNRELESQKADQLEALKRIREYGDDPYGIARAAIAKATGAA